MTRWVVGLHDDFAPEFDALPLAVQKELVARMELLRTVGPELGRPYVDTLSGARHANLKELRFSVADGVWRAAFAFDPLRRAVVLVAASKSGVSPSRFYKSLIALAEKRWSDHLERLRER